MPDEYEMPDEDFYDDEYDRVREMHQEIAESFIHTERGASRR